MAPRLHPEHCWDHPTGVCRNGGVTVSTESIAVWRHAGAWAPVIACKTKVANNNLALAA